MIFSLLLLMNMSGTPAPATSAPPTPLAIERKAQGRSSRATGNLVSLFSNDDYPASALARRQQGRVAVRLAIGRSGRPIRCLVTASSHVASLDRVTCGVLMERARFEPARDRHGRPVIDHYSQRVAWVMPSDDVQWPPVIPIAPVPFVNWQSRASFVVDAAGVGPCTLSDDNTPTAFRIGTCSELSPQARATVAKQAVPPRTPYRMVLSLRLVIGEALPMSATSRSRRTAKLRVDASGLLMACDPVGEVDSIDLAILCNRARAAPFDAIPAKTAGVTDRFAFIMETTEILPGL